MTAQKDRLTYAKDMGHHCDHCQGTSFRRSRLKGKDLSSLMLMRFPVRCMTCSQRQTVSIRVALRSVSSRAKQVREEQPVRTEQPVSAKPEMAKPVASASAPRSPLTAAMPDLHGVTLHHHTAVQDERAS